MMALFERVEDAVLSHMAAAMLSDGARVRNGAQLGKNERVSSFEHPD